MTSPRVVVFATLLTAGNVWAGDASHDLHLVWYDVTGVQAFAFDTMARELDKVVSDLGIRVDWRTAKGNNAVANGHEIRVVLMNEHPRSMPLTRRTMGATLRSDSIQTCVWIFLSNVRATLQLPRAADPGSVSNREMVATAVARVVAHELVHAVAPTLPHSQQGLMMPTLGRGQLLSSRIEITPAVRASVLDGLTALDSIRLADQSRGTWSAANLSGPTDPMAPGLLGQRLQ